MVELRSRCVFTNVGVEKEDLTVFYEGIRVLEIGAAFANAFNFSTLEGHACLKPLGQEEIMTGRSVLRSVALAARDGVPSDVLRLIWLSLVCGLASHDKTRTGSKS